MYLLAQGIALQLPSTPQSDLQRDCDAAAGGLMNVYDPKMAQHVGVFRGRPNQPRRPAIAPESDTTHTLVMVSQLLSAASSVAIYCLTESVPIAATALALDQASIPSIAATIWALKGMGNTAMSLVASPTNKNPAEILDPELFEQLGLNGKAKVLVEHSRANTDMAKCKAEERTKRLQICVCGVVVLCVVGVFFYVSRHPTTSRGSSSEGSVGGPSFTKLRL